MSPPRKSIQAINQDKPAAHEVFNYDSANRLQPPPSLPRRGGTDTLVAWLSGCYQYSRVICISPTGENERGLMSAGKIINIGFILVFVLNQQPRLLAKDRECPKHSRIHENPKINPMNTRLRKNQWKSQIRYTPSSSEENISKIWGTNHTNLIFSVT